MANSPSIADLGNVGPGVQPSGAATDARQIQDPVTRLVTQGMLDRMARVEDALSDALDGGGDDAVTMSYVQELAQTLQMSIGDLGTSLDLLSLRSKTDEENLAGLRETVNQMRGQLVWNSGTTDIPYAGIWVPNGYWDAQNRIPHGGVSPSLGLATFNIALQPIKAGTGGRVVSLGHAIVACSGMSGNGTFVRMEPGVGTGGLAIYAALGPMTVVSYPKPDQSLAYVLYHGQRGDCKMIVGGSGNLYVARSILWGTNYSLNYSQPGIPNVSLSSGSGGSS